LGDADKPREEKKKPKERHKGGGRRGESCFFFKGGKKKTTRVRPAEEGTRKGRGKKGRGKKKRRSSTKARKKEEGKWISIPPKGKKKEKKKKEEESERKISIRKKAAPLSKLRKIKSRCQTKKEKSPKGSARGGGEETPLALGKKGGGRGSFFADKETEKKGREGGVQFQG